MDKHPKEENPGAKHATETQDERRAPFGKRGRQLILLLHLFINASWLGALAVMVVLGMIKYASSASALDRAVFEVHEWLVIPCSLAVFGTSLAFALGTPWGLLRHWWLLLKWGILLAVAPMDIFLTTPAIARMVAMSDLDGASVFTMASYQQASRGALIWSAVELGLVAAAFLISVLKPWGKTTLPEPKRTWAAMVTGVLLLIILGFSLPIMMAQRAVRAYIPHPPDMSAIADGNYEGTAEHFGIVYGARVELRGGKIIRMEATRDQGGLYAELARGICTRVAREGKLEVDAISGATTTSRALQHAGVNALERAPKR